MRDGAPTRLFPSVQRLGLIHGDDGVVSVASLTIALEQIKKLSERYQLQARINHGNPSVRKKVEQKLALVEAAEGEIYGFLNPPTSWNDGYGPDAGLSEYGLVRCRATDCIEVFSREAAFNRSNLCERHWQHAQGIEPDESWRHPTPQTPTTPEGSEHDAQ